MPLSVDLNAAEASDRGGPVIEKTSSSKTVGPEPVGSYRVEQKVTKTEVNTLLLGPGIYRAFGFLPILKEVKSEKVPVHIIGGYGLSSVIATYYAFGFEPDLIEWKLFTHLIKASKPYPFSKKWLAAVFEILEKDFKNKKIEDSKISLFIPEYRDKKLNFATRGEILPRLKANLLLDRLEGLNNLVRNNPCKIKSVSRTLQTSKIICLNVLDSNLKWLSAKDYILGFYNKVSSLMESDSSESKISINLENLELDNLSKQPEILSRSREQAGIIIKKIFQQIKQN